MRNYECGMQNIAMRRKLSPNDYVESLNSEFCIPNLF